ncbi:MAG: adenylyltransferase/cytidyltransferase family protein [Candidatus Kariarchaeaceae archaeon]
MVIKVFTRLKSYNYQEIDILAVQEYHVVSKLQSQLLKQILRHWVLSNGPIEIGRLDACVPHNQILSEVKIMERSNLIERVDHNKLLLTEKGRSKISIVLTGGAYDLIHQGHLITLEEAASLGNFLLVVVARDTTIRKRKREPIHNEVARKSLLNSLKIVDAAILGDQDDHMKVVQRILPNVIAIGSDQHHIEEELSQKLSKLGMNNIEIIRLKAIVEGTATSHLIEEIVRRNSH